MTRESLKENSSTSTRKRAKEQSSKILSSKSIHPIDDNLTKELKKIVQKIYKFKFCFLVFYSILLNFLSPKNKSGNAIPIEISNNGIRKWNFANSGEDGIGNAIIIIKNTN